MESSFSARGDRIIIKKYFVIKYFDIIKLYFFSIFFRSAWSPWIFFNSEKDHLSKKVPTEFNSGFSSLILISFSIEVQVE
mgnify:CR=1 FL=1